MYRISEKLWQFLCNFKFHVFDNFQAERSLFLLYNISKQVNINNIYTLFL